MGTFELLFMKLFVNQIDTWIVSFPHAIVSWNIFMKIFQYKEVPSIGILKNDILSLIRPESKRFFKIHDTVGLRYLFQLRVGLSPLRGHRCCHNFIDTPSGICHCNQGIEDTNHFLFSCSLYTNLGATLVTSVNGILHRVNLNRLENQSQLHLYGDSSINSSDNKIIILSTIKYMKETRRFST